MCLADLATEKINEGKFLINLLGEKWGHVEGVQKLQRKIQQELNFLQRINKSQKIKNEHLQCSNLTHFNALVEVLHEVKNCLSLSKVFAFNDKRISVDIVCDNGLSWVKVIARNPRSLNQICMGDSSYGVRSIFEQAREFVQCSKLYPCLFQTPAVVFAFANGVGTNLASKLERLGVEVKGTRLEDDIAIDTDDEEEEDSDEDVEDEEETSDEDDEIDQENFQLNREFYSKNSENMVKINLDVSAMLAYVSHMTNGSKYLQFKVPVLRQQAEWESKRPVKPILDNLFVEKILYCCETAKTNFDNIIYTVGGPEERIRAEELMKRVQVLPDNATVDHVKEVENVQSDRQVFNSIQYSNNVLKVGGKIKERSLIIFTFGDRIQAMTVTANDGFVRAAKQKGVNFVVFVHESRALSEQKEMQCK